MHLLESKDVSSHVFSTPHINDHVQAVKHAAHRRAQISDIPGPNLAMPVGRMLVGAVVRGWFKTLAVFEHLPQAVLFVGPHRWLRIFANASAYGH